MPDTPLKINEGVQQRALPDMEPVEVPASGRTMSGYFVRWNEWTRISDCGVAYMESFAPGSMDEPIAARSMKCLFDHGQDPGIGRKVLGPGENVRDDGTGALYEVELYEAGYVDDLLPGLRGGQYGSSFRFRAIEQSINVDPGVSDHNSEGLPEVVVLKAHVPEFGPTPLPYYAGSTASIRSIITTKPSRSAAAPTKKEHGMPASTVESLLAEVRGLRSRMTEIDTEFQGRSMTPEAKTEFDAADASITEKTQLVDQLRSRSARLKAIAESVADDAGSVEHDADDMGSAESVADDAGSVEHERSVPNVPRAGVARGNDIWNLSGVRSLMFGDDTAERDLRDRSYRALEISGLRDSDKANIRSLIDENAEVAKRVMVTGSPQYRSAFKKTLMQVPLNGDEVRAMSLTGAAGGFATLPYVLDPTIIKTGALAINPLREISTTKQIAGTRVWKGVSSGAVVASFDAEASAVSDDAPTYAQPSVTCFPARAFVPFSFEVAEDYPGLLTDLGALIDEAKMTLEANKMTLGTGSGEPAGIITRATTTVATAGAATFVRGDLDLLDNALPARYQQNASIIGNRAILNRVPAFDTTNGNTLFGGNAQLAQPRGTSARMRFDVLGLPTYQISDMVTTLTTGSKILVEGDFRQFVIVDRIGMSVELVQNLFDVTTGRPTGQRGLLAHWAVGSDVTNAAAFRTLVTA